MSATVEQAEARIVALLQERGCILLEQLLASLPEMTWNQIFAMVDALSRREVIRLRRRGFDYELEVRAQELSGSPLRPTCVHTAEAPDSFESNDSSPQRRRRSTRTFPPLQKVSC